MMLIADSGSSKTDWRLVHPDGSIQQFKSRGFNPFYQSESAIGDEIAFNLKPQLPEGITDIFYYGAGCVNPEKNDILKRALVRSFSEAAVVVDNDILGAARALCHREPGIACILGTGANSCLYDGEKIAQNIRGYGFLLGDEGSGSYLGKQLIIAYLRKELPDKLHAQFKNRFPMSEDEILEQVYKKPFPNRYLASFSKFLFHHVKEPYVYELIYNSFSLFMDKNVLTYENIQQYKVHFVGSVAFYYANILRQVANDKGVVLKNILESPIAGLTLYHQSARP
ncbi:N-acetylglucosamine kinase [Fulvivirgaceae bacterium BMA12]|uniref:N-acetylglucosamine kinase n=1 Tax=Agaribacillus aureus TaxID=3051825 RepID=A0ABT8LFQ0_9BACT|nr:N-acetylglucosamine kinase [Fulvivirgaceae bacterium BMA12]